MDIEFQQRFSEHWQNYFPGADLPMAFYYTDDDGQEEAAQTSKGSRCVIGNLARVRKGKSLRLNADTIGCGGGQRYLGFVQSLRPNFEYFLSYGIPGEMEGERYKKSPELVSEQMKHQPPFEAPGKYILFKRWDKLEAEDNPLVVVFFAPPDVLSGLFTLANYDEAGPQAVIAPFSAGCASIVYYPYRELEAEHPRAVLGMFDVSARPYVPSEVLTFAVPWPKFVSMVENVEESFLITPSWHQVRSRMQRQ